MLCPLCGTDVGEKISLCDSCKAKQEEQERIAREQEEAQRLAEAEQGRSGRKKRKKAAETEQAKESADGEGEETGAVLPGSDFSPAGFWWRFFAFVFDSSVLLLLTQFIARTFDISLSEVGQLISGGAAAITLSLVKVGAALGLYFPVHFLYYTLFESSGFRATPGKMLFGLQVVDAAGEKVTFGSAAIRWVASGFSFATIFIGFILAGLTEQKRALHDMMSGCYVEKDDEVSTSRRLSCAIVTMVIVYFTPKDDFRPVRHEETAALPYNSQHFQNAGSGETGTGMQPGATETKVELGKVPELDPGSAGYILIDKAAVVFRSAVAFRNPIDRLIYVGLFENKLTDEQRDQIRANGSIMAIDEAQPLAWFKLRFSKESRSCNLATLEQYTFTIQRSGPIFLKDDLPSIEFNRAGSWKSSSEISKFECSFTDNGRFRGMFNDTSLYQFSAGPLRFTWFIELDTPLIAISEETAIKLEKSRQNKQRGAVDFSLPGTIKINDSETQFRSSAALIYPQYNRIEIGFYADQLTEAESAQIGEARFLKQIKTKLPSAVLNLKFKKGSASALLENLESYNLYLYRDSLAKLTFPGSEEVLGISREEPLELKRDFSQLSGELGAGKQFSGVLDTRQVLGDLRINAEIFLHFKVTPGPGK